MVVVVVAAAAVVVDTYVRREKSCVVVVDRDDVVSGKEKGEGRGGERGRSRPPQSSKRLEVGRNFTPRIVYYIFFFFPSFFSVFFCFFFLFRTPPPLSPVRNDNFISFSFRCVRHVPRMSYSTSKTQQPACT